MAVRGDVVVVAEAVVTTRTLPARERTVMTTARNRRRVMVVKCRSVLARREKCFS
jgi:hypothetical protein